MSFSPSLIIDIALVLLLIITVFSYRKKGFLAALCELVGSLAAAIGAFIGASRLSSWLFESFFKADLVERAGNVLVSAAGAVKTSEIVESLLSFLPDGMVESLMQKADHLISLADPVAPDVAANLVDSVIAPVLIPLISIVLFFVIFAVARLMLSFLISAFTGVNHIPLVGGINRLFGMIAGFFIGAVNIYIVVCALAAVVLITSNELTFLNTSVLQGSFFCGLLWNINPFV